jgi:Lon-like protease
MSRLDQPTPMLSGPAARSASGLTPRSLTIIVTGLLAIALVAVISLMPAPYAIYAPGPVTNVLGDVGNVPLIRIEGTDSFRPAGRGTLDMTTVEVFGGPGHKVSLLSVLQSWVSPTQAVLPVEQVFPPGQTADEAEAETAAEMSQSQQSATAAGLREAGRTVPETVTIADVSANLPAAKVLKQGDVVTRL